MKLSLVASSDENYAMALGVMIRSVLENLRAGVQTDLFVLEDNLSLETRTKLLESWKPFQIDVHWLSPDRSRVQGRTQARGHAGVPATYFRLFMGELIPSSVGQVIYLDVDLLVVADLYPLVDSDFAGTVVQAVPDAYTDYFHRGRLRQANLPDDLRYHDESGYFNAGLMVIDLEKWRDLRVGQQAYHTAIHHGDELLFHDQDALNLILAGKWKALEPTWNFHELPQFLSKWEVERYERDQLRELFFNPKVIHFVSGEKPWTSRCYHFYQAPAFFEVLSRTAWRGFRPPALPWIRSLWERVMVEPNIQWNWCLWRGLIHAYDPRIFRLLVKVFRQSPWVVFSYPLWILLGKKPML